MSSAFSWTKPVDVCSVLLNNEYVKSVTVPEAKQHQESYTVYKIILQAIKAKQTIEENPLSFIAWKRFRDLYKLYRRLLIIHAQLYLKGAVPSFPKPDFFGRLDPVVVEERRQASEQLLSFVVQNPILCQCEAVLAFFSGAESYRSDESALPSSYSSSIPSPCPPPLSPVTAPPLHPALANLVESGRSFSESSDMSDDFPSLVAPIKADEGQAALDRTDLLSVFDPLRPTSTAASGSNYQLLSEVMCELQIAVSESGDDPLAGTADDSARVYLEALPPTGRSLSSCARTDARSVPHSDSNTAPVEEGKKHARKKWRSKIAEFFPRLSPSSSKYTVNSSCPASNSSTDLKTVKSESQICNVNQAGDGRRSSQSTRVRGRRGGSPSIGAVASRHRSSIDYVIQAAEFISSAQKAEDENAFDLAFTCYKSAVMLLLQGVQDEKDLNRRNAVRVKTAKYLKKAEELYATYIAAGADSSYCLDGFTSRFLSNFGIAGFQSVYSELSQYKVLRVLGKRVQLVQDVTSGEKYAVMFLDKSCYTSDYSASNLLDHSVPTRVPHMVQLVKFWDTENAFILLLEHAAGGQLWRRLRNYFEKARRLFQRHYEKANGEEKYKQEGRRSGSADNIAAMVNQRVPLNSRHRSRSGSDPCDRVTRSTRIFSVASEVDDELGEETLTNDTSLFDMYERKSMRPHRSTEDSFSLDTAPPSAVANRRFSLLYSQNNVSQIVDEYILRKWVAQITVALGYLHSEGVICRDLNPDNLLLDDQDNVLLTFFCNWSGVDRPFNHRAASMLYSAPEVDGTNNEPVTDAADWWSLGVILYEIATGTPLHKQCQHGVGPNMAIPLPDYLPIELRDLITRLTQFDAEDRLGSCFGGVDEIKMHPYFMDFDWRTVEPS